MKTNLDSLLKTNTDLENEGVWFKIGDCRFLVRRWGGDNEHFSKAMAKYHKPFTRQIQLGSLTPKQNLEILAKVFASACLVKWEGIKADDKDLEFNFDNAVNLLLTLPELFDILYQEANSIRNYKEEYKEELGNS